MVPLNMIVNELPMMNDIFVDLITAYVKNYKELKRTATDWREPVIGFADALKEIIGPNHALPEDLVPCSLGIPSKG